ARMVRSSIVEVMKEDYIRTARAKGLYERLVVSRHAMRNALLPAITVIGLEFAFLIGGLVVTEQVFNLNGIGKLFVQAVSRNDFTLIQTMVMLLSVIYIFVNLVIDVLYAMLAAPDAAHPMGTDAFGRDILTRIIYGARTALLIGFLSSFVGCTLGAAI